MNLHLPQTEEAKAEAIVLMGVSTSLCCRTVLLTIFVLRSHFRTTTTVPIHTSVLYALMLRFFVSPNRTS